MCVHSIKLKNAIAYLEVTNSDKTQCVLHMSSHSDWHLMQSLLNADSVAVTKYVQCTCASVCVCFMDDDVSKATVHYRSTQLPY